MLCGTLKPHLESNKIDAFMKTMAALAGLDTTNKKFTNHCVRKTLVRKLQKHGISNDKIASITGHSTEQSLRDYADTDLSDHASISKILSLPHQRPQEQPGNGAISLLHQPYPAHSTGSSSHSTSVASSSQYDSVSPPLLYPCSSVSIHFLFSCPLPHPFLSHNMFSTVVMFILEQTLVHAHLQNTIPKMYQLENDLLLMTTLISFTHVCITAILKSVLPLCQTMGTMVDSVIMINL